VILAAVSSYGSLTFSFQEKFPILEGALKSPEIRLLQTAERNFFAAIPQDGGQNKRNAEPSERIGKIPYGAQILTMPHARVNY
jgi:hypothetical protein